MAKRAPKTKKTGPKSLPFHPLLLGQRVNRTTQKEWVGSAGTKTTGTDTDIEPSPPSSASKSDSDATQSVPERRSCFRARLQGTCNTGFIG